MMDYFSGSFRQFLAAVVLIGLPVGAFAVSPDSAKGKVLPSLSERFSGEQDIKEVPDFQKHVVPLLSRLGCNGRACHGSFQGRGGFQLSLFGYDFSADHKALFDEESPRVDTSDVEESLILAKPTDEDMHEGGKRYDADGWQYRVLRRWIEEGAEFNDKKVEKLSRLEVLPTEVLFEKGSKPAQLQAIAHWADGTSEDVTELCRFHSNDDAIAAIDEAGIVSTSGVGDTHVVVSYDKAVVPIPVLRPVEVDATVPQPKGKPRTEIDRLIAVKLNKLGIVPSEICSDSDFLRRASLDIAGTLPTAAEVKKFLDDKSSNKRSEKIDELLNSTGYSAWWTTRFCDWTGNSVDKLNNVSPVRNAPPEHWYEWIYKRIDENMPYDEIVEGIVNAQSRHEGESYRDFCEAVGESCQKNSMEQFADRPGLTYFWARNNFKNTEDRAIGFSYTFLGVRIQCAQCHKHPFDQWSKKDFDEFKNLFQTVVWSQKPRPGKDLDQYNELMAQFDTDGLRGNQLRTMLAKELNKGAVIPFPELIERPVRGTTKVIRKKGKKPQKVAGDPPKARLLGGDYVQLDEMAREKLMDWLRDPENPYFAKAIVNRVWANYFGVGIVDPVDDLNLANPPSNKALFDYLAEGFIENGYDLKWLHREITSSDAYQRSWETNPTNVLDKKNFSHFIPRRMAAEVLYDSMQIATAGAEKCETLCNTRDGRALSIASASARRRSNDPASYAMSVFGRSIRESNCDCDRSEEPNLLQTVYMQNDRDMNSRLHDRNGWLAETMKELGQPMPVSSTASAEAARRKAEAAKRAAKQRATYVSNMEKRQRQIEDQLRSLRKRSDVPEKTKLARIAQYEKSIAGIKKKIKGIAGGSLERKTREPEKVTDDQLAEVIREAYLRTVSRRPSAEELSTSLAFVHDSNTVAEGVSGVLWALVNTKEFLLVH